MSRFYRCVFAYVLSGALAFSARAATEQRVQTFTGDPLWEGQGNHALPHDFGFSAATGLAGGDFVGEGGGYIERGAPAWYADPRLGNLDLTQESLSVSGTFLIDVAGNPSFGYFKASDWASGENPQMGLYFALDDNNLWFHWKGGGGSGSRALVGAVTYGQPFHVAMNYDPNGAGGNGSWSISLDGAPAVTMNLPAGVKAAIQLERFGLFTLGASAGHGCNFWFDDLEFTVEAGVVTPTPEPTPEPTPTPPPLAAVQCVETFDDDPGWEGRFNRSTDPGCRITTQDFGYSASTQHVGNAAGEMGGFVQPAADTAYVGKVLSPALTFEDAFTASGKFILPSVNSAGQAMIGFFNADTVEGWRTPSTLGIRFNGRGNGFFASIDYATQLWRAGGGGFPDGGSERLFPAGPVIYQFTISYDPDGNGGGGRATMDLNGDVAVVDLEPGHKADGVVFDRFGLFNVMKSNDSGMDIWLDDLNINGVTEDFSTNPGWDEFQNRRSYTDCIIRPRFDFGFSPTNHAGATDGEMGGVIFRGDFDTESLMASYGDQLQPLTLAGPLVASGRLAMHRGISDSSVLFGWYHSSLSREGGTTESALPQDFLGVMLEGPSREGFFFRPAYRLDGLTRAIQASGPYIYPNRDQHDWTLEYSPDTNNGHGSITVTLDGEEVVLNLGVGHKEIGARFDRFGIISTQVDGHYQILYFDDLSYTCEHEEADPEPTPEPTPDANTAAGVWLRVE